VDDVLTDELHANERTTRAWVRTGLGFVAVGVALAKFIAEPHANEWGGAFVALGFLIMALGLLTSRTAHRRLRQGTYRPNRLGVALVSAAFGVVTVVVMLTIVL